MDLERAHDAMQRLARFVGRWDMEAIFPSNPGQKLPGGSAVFEWMKGQNLLVQRTEVPIPEVPDSISIVAYDEDTNGYVQHYFDSRGIVRLYRMSFEDGLWTLLREAPDFSPLDFTQRYAGTFSDDGNTIRGAWETSTNGHWQKDFDVSYFRTD